MKNTSIILCAILFLGFSKEAKHANAKVPDGHHIYLEDDEEVIVEEVKTDMRAFLDAVAFSESSGVHDTVNKFGYLGLYQFSKRTLRGIGYKMSREEFLNNPEIQEAAMVSYLIYNKKILKKILPDYLGKTIKNIYITESGVLAACHLAGAGNVKKWLKSNGKRTRKDKFGTSIETYLSKFSNYKLTL